MLAGALAYFAFLSPSQNPVKQTLGLQTVLEKFSDKFEAEHADKFIVYADADYGFSLKYPLGYRAIRTDEDDARVIFSAESPEGLSENFIVTITREPFGASEFREIVDLYKPEYVKLAKETTINGRRAFLLYVEGPDEIGGVQLVRQATVMCGTEEGSYYAAILSGVIPEGLAAQTAVSDYMISTFECPG